MKEKDEKSELRRIWKELEKAALAPRSALTRSAKFAQNFRENNHEFNPFFGLIFSVAFEDALPQKVPKMLCHYPRKQLRAKRQTQNSNLKTSLEKQTENVIS